MKPFPHLETFIEAAERGTIPAAAKAKGLTQAAVSQGNRADDPRNKEKEDPRLTRPRNPCR